MGFDCAKVIARCKGECCGPCPIPRATWNVCQDKVQGEVAEVLYGGAFVHVVTAEGACPFRSPDGRCAIYPALGQPDQRAEVCRKFGDESHPCMTCRWQDKWGRVRSAAERRRLSRWIDAHVDATLERIKERTARSTP